MAKKTTKRKIDKQIPEAPVREAAEDQVELEASPETETDDPPEVPQEPQAGIPVVELPYRVGELDGRTRYECAFEGCTFASFGLAYVEEHIESRHRPRMVSTGLVDQHGQAIVRLTHREE